MTSQTLETLVQWSEPKFTTNSRGPRMIRTAIPTNAFWGAWRAEQDAIRKLGCNPKLEGRDQWIVIWYQDAPVSAVTAPVPVTPVIQSGMSWSSEQEAIFAWFRTPSAARALVVKARAGTGKTTTIKAALGQAPEDRMLYAVFNKKNQVEATTAISDPRVEIKTLHSLGFMFIQQVWPNVKPTDEVEKERVELAVGAQTPREVKTQVQKLVGFAKNMLVNPTLETMMELAVARSIECPQFEADANGGWNITKLAYSAIRVLELSMERDAQGRISFNDMVWLPCRMGWVRAWFDLVVVDEAQDMNVPQLLMAKGACKEGGRICVVGDDRQAIYGFRGAAQDGMDMMRETLSAVELGLTITYRCPKAVVALAAAIVPDYKAAPSAPEGLVEMVMNLGVGIKVGDAILSRSNSPLMPLCLSLLRKGIPARIEGRDIGKMLLDIIKKLNAHTVPQFMTRVTTWGDKQRNRFMATKQFEEKCEEINDQVDTLIALAEGASSVSEIEARCQNLFQDSATSTTPTVVLSSVHKAKGLEWTKVYLLRSTFNRKRPANAAPLSPAVEQARAKEEANIYYVALTRSKHHLVLIEGQNP
jgi:superfamily I DNA/RNA helicase